MELEILRTLAKRKPTEHKFIQNTLAGALKVTADIISNSLAEPVARGYITKTRIPVRGQQGTCQQLDITPSGWSRLKELEDMDVQGELHDEMGHINIEEFNKHIDDIIKNTHPRIGYSGARRTIGNEPCINDIEAVLVIEKCLRGFFSWSKVPGTDDEGLRRYLTAGLQLDWANSAQIRKIGNDKPITIISGKDLVKIRLSGDKDTASLKTSDGITQELVAKEENGELNIYFLGKGECDGEARIYLLRILGEILERGCRDNIFHGGNEEIRCRLHEMLCKTLGTGRLDTKEDVPLFDWNKVMGEDKSKFIAFMQDHGAEWHEGCEIEDQEDYYEKVMPDVKTEDVIVFRGDGEYYFFCWDKIPGTDDGKLSDYLRDELRLDWADSAEIKKIDDEEAISISSGTNGIEIRLSGDRKTASLKTSDGGTLDFIVREEGGERIIYGECIKVLLVVSMKCEEGTIFVDGDFSVPRYVARRNVDGLMVYRNWLVPEEMAAAYNAMKWVCFPWCYKCIVDLCLQAMRPTADRYLLSEAASRTIDRMVDDVVQRDPSLFTVARERLLEFHQKCKTARSHPRYRFPEFAEEGKRLSHLIERYLRRIQSLDNTSLPMT